MSIATEYEVVSMLLPIAQYRSLCNIGFRDIDMKLVQDSKIYLYSRYILKQLTSTSTSSNPPTNIVQQKQSPQEG